MLEKEVVEEIQELMSAMHLPFIAWGIGDDKIYYSIDRISDIPFVEKYELLEDMKLTYEKVNKTPWYSNNNSE